MNWIKILLLFIFLLSGIFSGDAQNSNEPCDCVYPIVFVHGFGGHATTFETIYESDLNTIWSGGHDVFNAVLNANTGTNIFGNDNKEDDDKVDDVILYKDDDVIIQFKNEKNDLKYSCLYVVNFNNYWNENPSNPEIRRDPPTRDFLASYNPGIWRKPDSRSNQSSAYKQGYVLGKAIEKILDVTGKSKVIIIAHSMGGLASREYLQRKENGINKWWANKEDLTSGHGVAKLFTIGTPHRGSNFHISDLLTNFVDVFPGFIVNSEAARDLRFSTILSKPLNPLPTDILFKSQSGTYLFGGSESSFKDINGFNLEILIDKYYYNYDFNCNGENFNEVIGLNMPGDPGKGNSSRDNDLMPLPRDIKYTYYIGTLSREGGLIGQIGVTGDGVVSDDRQWLFQGGKGNIRDYINGSSIPIPSDGTPHRLSDRFTSPNFKLHTKEPEDLHQIIRGIDEADFPFFAHEISDVSDGSGRWYSGLVQKRADKVPTSSTPTTNISLIPKLNNLIDPDWYMFELSQEIPSITLHFEKRENTLAYLDFYSKVTDYYSNDNGTVKIDATNQSDVSFDLSQNSSIRLENIQDGSITLRLTDQGCIKQGKYYFRVTHSLIDIPNKEEAWKQPYKFKIEKELGPCKSNCGITASVSQDNDCTNVDAIESDIKGQSDPSPTVDITSVEYWFDEDFQNRVVAASNEYSSLELNKLMSTNTLDAGLHTVHIRFKDTNGKYSSAISHPFEKTNGVENTEKTLLAYQYWFDEDFETRVVEVADIPFKNKLDLIEDIDASNLSKGLHEIHIRFVDNSLKWSNVVSKLFHNFPKGTGKQYGIQRYRYWFDQDKDFTNIEVADQNTTIELLEDLDVKDLEEGGHLFYIQFQDMRDQWSSPVSYMFEKFDVSKTGKNDIVSYEYWLDNDLDSKVYMDVDPTQEYVLITKIPYQDLSSGIHSFNFRFKDSFGRWSIVENRLFEKINRIPNGVNKIIGYKYWLDNDRENSVSINLDTPQTALQLITNIDANNLEPGSHTFYLQFLDITGKWSSLITEPFNKNILDSVNTAIYPCLNNVPVSYLKAKAVLQGCFDKNQNLMNDDLRRKGLIPMKEPYSEIMDRGNSKYSLTCGGYAIMDSNSVFKIIGNDAIVDWVFVELRNETDTQVVATRVALIQRDGDIVELDGESPLAFPVSSGNYFVAVRHRVHLGAMTAKPLYLEEDKDASVDFSDPSTPIFGEHSTVNINGVMALWSGNSNNDDKIIFSGIDNDRDNVFFNIFYDQINRSIAIPSYNHIAEGYYNSDLNMDGEVIYQGTENDIDQYIFFNTLFYPENPNNLMQFTLKENIPK